MIDSRVHTFITVAKTKNFTRAAEALNLTQPGVYQQIQYLERYYGTKFIQKEGRTLKLTEEGEFFLQYAKEIANISAEMERNLRNGAPTIKRHHIAATMTIGGYVIPTILGAYKKENPNTNIALSVSNTSVILKKIIDREVELALVEGPFDRIKFKHRKFKEDELVLAVSKSHDFAKRKFVQLDEVLKGNLILREPDSGTREIFEGELISHGYSVDTISGCMEVESITATISLVKENVGYTIISREAIKREVKEGSIVIVPIENFTMYRDFNFIYLYEKEMDFMEDFIEYCCNYKVLK
ncbi:LysR family transcriptional regulator [Alkaliphilus oremlandii]|uniref:Transcriptional regulator, LysR family n=1 Tax=Alkaliphilus oremlandii (strain OhILAs) TaxID=350688 RepID=A8MG35_ALKOO|nr:LysR family transcriptional regulator [Alkaliphilus oremlandii]ABW18573.1 transcriptional regulator, LysR family [Alkaliphilus oremlandii OhILAs]